MPDLAPVIGMIKRWILLLGVATAAMATAAEPETGSKAESEAESLEVPPPSRNPFHFDGEYRFRASLLRQDRVPRLLPESGDQIYDHRFRLGLNTFPHPDVIVRLQLTTRISRFGDFDTTTFTLNTNRFNFEQLYAVWKAHPKTQVIIGRGNNRYFELDLAAATGRFDEDNVQYEGLVVEHKPDERTTFIAAYGIVFASDLLDANPVEFRLDGTLLQVRRRIGDIHRILLHWGDINPRKGHPLTGGTGRPALAALRYDLTPEGPLRAFVQVSRTIRTIDGFTFLPLMGTDLDDRMATFAGIQFGNKENLHENQFELYFTRTGGHSQALVSQFPDNIREIRGIWERQVAPKIWTRVSLIHRQLNVAQPLNPRNDVDTAFAQVLMRF